MPTTALDIITDTLNWMNVYAPGEPISAADQAQSLTRLNDMIDSWSNESLTCYAILEQTGVLIPGKYQYTIGTSGGADFNMTRPIRLIKTYGSVYIVDTNGNRYNLEVVERDSWNMIGNIINVNSNFPNTIFYDPQFPLGILNVFPVPNIGYTMHWDSYLQLTEFPLQTTQVTLPPGYNKALKDNLALELWPYFKPAGSMPTALMVKTAYVSKGNVKRSNYRLNMALFDPEIVRTGSPVFNIYSGGPRGPS